MKAMKAFVKTCYSDALLSAGSSTLAANEREDGSLIKETDANEENAETFHGGLGLKFRFPGDSKKCVNLRSFMRTPFYIHVDYEKHLRSSFGSNIYKVC